MAQKRAKKPAKGKNLTKGGGWKLEATKGRNRSFSAKLLSSHNLGEKRIAIFSVPKGFR